MSDSSRIPIVVVVPEESVEASHEVGHVCSSPGQRHLAAYSLTHPSVLLLSEECRRETTLAKPPGELCLSVNLTGNLLAYSDLDNRLRVRSLPAEQEVIVDDCPEVLDVRFDEQGRLWTVRRHDELLVEVRGAGDWRVIGQSEVSDFGAGADIRPGPSQEVMFVSPYSGQSEQENFLCDFENGELRTQSMRAMDGDQFVFAAPGIAKVVALDFWHCEIACFTHPYDAPVARRPWPDFDEEEREYEQPGYYGCFLDDEHFLAGSSEGRLFVFQLTPLGVKKEIHVAGYEPVPSVVKFPTLKDASGLVSDLLYFGQYGEHVAAFFAPDHRSPRPQLVTLRVSDLLM
jgi:hypothetical protein